MLIRLYRYAQTHLVQAEQRASHLKRIWEDIEIHVHDADHEYMNAINSGELYVPIDYMRSSNEFEGDRVKLEDCQKNLMTNLCLSLTFCGEMIIYIIDNQDSENLKFRKPIRLLIERIFTIAEMNYTLHSSIVELVSIGARIESTILLKNAEIFGLIRRTLYHKRLLLSKR